MSQELTLYEGKRPLVMKSGLVHWITDATAERIQQELETQTAHRFMKIRELNVTINTAEVEGMYTMEQYEDFGKVKQGMWKCEYGKWHNKGKRECECKSEVFKRNEERKRKEETDRDNRPMTEEEKARNRNAIRLMEENAALDGSSIFRPMMVSRGKPVRRSTIEAWEKKNGAIANLDGLVIEEDIANATRAEAIEALA